MNISIEVLEDKTVAAAAAKSLQTVAQIVKEWNAKKKIGGKVTTLEDQVKKTNI